MTALPKQNRLAQSLKLALFLVILLGIFLSHATPSYVQAESTQKAEATTLQKPKYIFLFIGDGMGLAHRMAVEYCLAEKAGESIPTANSIMRMTMDQLPVQSPMTTFSSSSYTTDSAASGTAIACGAKTKNKYLGILPDRRPLVSIAKVAHDQGYRIGLLSSVPLDHATPAAFYAHIASRYQYADIPRQLIDSNYEYFAGGGLLGNEKRKSGTEDFYKQMKQKGISVVKTFDDLEACKPGGRVYAYTGSGTLSLAINEPNKTSYLAKFTKEGIRLLDNPGGFFMMVEGGIIDWAGHGNDAGSVVAQTLALDEAVTVAYDFLKKHPNETLILVTADHETGGLTIGTPGVKPGILCGQPYSVDVFRNKLKGVEEKPFEDALPIIIEFYGGKENLAKKDRTRLNEMWDALLAVKNAPSDEERREAKAKNRLRYGRSQPRFAGECVRLRDQASGIFFSHGSHTSIPVITSAAGVGQDLFAGFHDNTDIAKKIGQLLGVQFPIITEKEKKETK